MNGNQTLVDEIKMPFAETLQDDQAEMGEVSQQKMAKILNTL